MKAITYKPLTLVIALLASTILLSQNVPERPVPPRLVNDFADILSPSEEQMLERKLVDYNDTTSTQIAIVIVTSLDGYDKATYAYKVGETWGVGQKDQNNGVVVLLKPKTASENGEVFIAPGYGLEPVIPDAIAKRIVENEMIPAFRKNDYYTGLEKGTNTIMSLASGEFTASDYKRETGSPLAALIIPIIIIVMIIVLMRSGRSKSYTMGSKGSSLPFWAALFMLGSMSNRSHHNDWDNFKSGGGSFGGFGGFGGGGGGFGGFGGGSFGGGGAGGSW